MTSGTDSFGSLRVFLTDYQQLQTLYGIRILEGRSETGFQKTIRCCLHRVFTELLKDHKELNSWFLLSIFAGTMKAVFMDFFKLFVKYRWKLHSSGFYYSHRVFTEMFKDHQKLYSLFWLPIFDGPIEAVFMGILSYL